MTAILGHVVAMLPQGEGILAILAILATLQKQPLFQNRSATSATSATSHESPPPPPPATNFQSEVVSLAGKPKETNPERGKAGKPGKPLLFPHCAFASLREKTTSPKTNPASAKATKPTSNFALRHAYQLVSLQPPIHT